jgi:hypothetical protein
MSGDAVDVSCVVFHDECSGLGATLCGGELFAVVVAVVVVVVVVVVQSESCVFRSRRGHQYGGGIDEQQIPPVTSLIVPL